MSLKKFVLEDYRNPVAVLVAFLQNLSKRKEGLILRVQDLDYFEKKVYLTQEFENRSKIAFEL